MKTEITTEKALIGKRLAQLRKKIGLTQNELAAKLGISRSSLGAYESGRLRLHDEILIKISKELKTTADDILGLKMTKSPDVNPSLKFVKRFRRIEKLDYLKQKKILSTLDDLIIAAEKK